VKLLSNIGVVLTGVIRDELTAALYRAGYEVHIAADLSRLQALIARDVVDAWIFDARADKVLEQLLPTGRFLLPADNIPSRDNYQEFSQWLEVLLSQLDAAQYSVAGRSTGSNLDRWSEVESVWLLAGSAGATGAVQQFLNVFTKPPPIAFLYAQHLDPLQQHQLERFTLQNQAFSLAIAQGACALQPGRIVMISPRCKVAVNAFGRVSSTRLPWDGQHTPDINELMIILSAASLPAPGVILFSGMGDDGVASLPIFDACGGRIWAQSPSSAICPAMPEAAIESGMVQKIGDPVALARALEAIYDPQEHVETG
jgi:chemosensory pili system protein ChpB (putative protein-glutamate methylesterase)